MNDKKLNELFSAARREPVPVPGEEFVGAVMRNLGPEPRPAKLSLVQQLGILLPRLAVAAAVVIGLCVAADFCLAAYWQSDFSAGVAELSEQWLFAVR